MLDGQFSFPLVDIDRLSGSFDCLVLGLPFDGNTVTVPGSRYGPAFLLETRPRLDWVVEQGHLTGLFDYRRGRLMFDQFKAGDLGNLTFPIPYPAGSRIFQQIEAYAALMAASARLPILVGGDHSLSLPIVKGIMQERDVETIVIFDAHSDIDTFHERRTEPTPLHNNFVSFLLTEYSDVEIIQIGVRDLSLPCRPHINRLTQIGAIPISDIVQHLNQCAAVPRRKAHLSIDVDVIDPASFGHVSAPLGGGYNFREFGELVDIVASVFDVQSLDIMEICPNPSRQREEGMFLNNALIQAISVLAQRS